MRFVPLSLAGSGRDPRKEVPSAKEMPDLAGRSLREAANLLASLGLSPRVEGQGPIVGGQRPDAGAEVVAGATCTLTMTGEGP